MNDGSGTRRDSSDLGNVSDIRDIGTGPVGDGNIRPDPIDFDASRLAGRRMLVTGGSSGIGAAAVRRFAHEGAAVVAAARRGDRLEEVCAAVRAELPDSAGPVLPVVCDVRDEQSIAGAVDCAVQRLGGLDAAFNAHGVGGAARPLHEISAAQFDEIVDVNLRGAFLAMKYEIAAMLDGGGGAVVNASSIAGLVGAPGVPDYSVTKWGLNGLTRTAAVAYAGRNIRVNAIAAGATMTELTEPWMVNDEVRRRVAATAPLPFLALPDDMARVAVFLLSDEARWITGSVVPVDGGASAD